MFQRLFGSERSANRAITEALYASIVAAARQPLFYSDWNVPDTPLGRRFRALKLWFLLRAHGLEGLRQTIRNHVRWSEKLASRLAAVPGFEIVTEPMLSLFAFRHQARDEGRTDEHNLALVDTINNDGRIYLTQTRVDGRVAIRFQAGQFETTEADVDAAFDVITNLASASNSLQF